MALKKSDLYSSIWKACDELRGGMDASQYKDYVLVLLFVKYVSDKYGNDPDPLIEIPRASEPGKGGSFSDMVHWKGKAEIGDQINKIIGRLAEANGLKGEILVADFNDSSKLGRGKEMVERLSKLIAIFEKPELDMRKNKAEGDDLLGDAYEYLMKKFAVQSGKSKGQFYTPAEVSRVMSKVIGIAHARRGNQSVYDPTCGSGSLLIKAASETDVGISVFGQEIDNSMAGLARMNMILHDIPTAEIHKDNTLSAPGFKNRDGSLMAFDFAVANPPFSKKNWKYGFDPEHDPYNRFDGFGIPPEKNGDYAFLLHLIKSLKSTGKGAIILPHGVLFRGGSEAEIRRNLVKRGYIKGIIGLPANLFFGTGIPACIIVIDKENAGERKGIFIINASRGYAKDGNKNRLREQDIHKIVDVFNKGTKLEKYSRLVTYPEIEKNEYNLNIPRYIDTSDPEDLQDIEAHLMGGIPSRDVHALEDFWSVMPGLKARLFSCFGRNGYMKLNLEPGELREAILEDREFVDYKERWMGRLKDWAEDSAGYLKNIRKGDNPKKVIHTISETLLAIFKPNPLLDGYDIYQILMQYWADTMQDDTYVIAAEGWQANNDVIPAGIVSEKYFKEEREALDEFEEEKAGVTRKMEELEEEAQGEDEDLLEEGRNDKGKLTKKLIQDRLKELGDQDAGDEAEALSKYLALIDEEAKIKSRIKKAEKELQEKVEEKYQYLGEQEIKSLIVDDKWLENISNEIQSTLEAVSHRLASRLGELAERYGETLPELEAEVGELKLKVEEHLKKMGFSWK